MQRCNINNHLTSASPLNCGVPQGSPRMYVDDTNVTFSAATIPDLESQSKSDLKYIEGWLKANKFKSQCRQNRVYGY